MTRRARVGVRVLCVLRLTTVMMVLAGCSGSGGLSTSSQGSATFSEGPSMPSLYESGSSGSPMSSQPLVVPPTSDSTNPQSGGPAFLSAASGRHFIDQFGNPYLANWETAWFIFSQLSFDDQTLYLSDRRSRGFNGVLAAWFATTAGAGSWNTYDGLSPFIDGDISAPNPEFWDRMDKSIDLAAQYGMTVMLGVATTDVFSGSPYEATEAQCEAFGRLLGERYKNKPNIAYLFGVDYNPDEWAANDPKFDAVLRGIRSTGDNHLATLQLFNRSSSLDNPFWSGKYQFVDLYIYRKTYAGALETYNSTELPIFGGEYNFEGENNEEGPPTTDETLRRQVGWSLTCGLTGWTYGNKDIWRLDDGWKSALTSSSFVTQNQKIYDRFSTLDWWKLVPDQNGSFLASGAGVDPESGSQSRNDVDPLESDYATSAVASDRSLAVAYVPTAREISVDHTKVNKLTTAYWVDASDATVTRPATFDDGLTTTPGPNSVGDGDWFLVLQGQPAP